MAEEDKIKVSGKEENTNISGNDSKVNISGEVSKIKTPGNDSKVNTFGNDSRVKIFGINLQTIIAIATGVIVMLLLFFPNNPAFTFISQVMSNSDRSVDDAKYPLTRDLFLLDTFCQLTIYEGGGEEAMSDAVTKLNYYDDIFNKSKEDSDISHINNRNSKSVRISEDTADMLKFARAFCEESGGVLEPAIAPVSSLWDFKEEKKVPDRDKIDDALKKVKSLKWDIDGDSFIAFDEDVRIDIGSFAKGYVADKIKEDMLSNGVTSAIINLGGNVLCIGKRPDGKPFEIAIKEPGKSAAQYSHIIDIDDDSIVTAGIYERSFECDGVIYHHILNADTGYPVQNELESVTVIGDESVVCDALCTTVFILGEEKGSAYIDQYNEKHGTDYYAVFLYREGSNLD